MRRVLVGFVLSVSLSVTLAWWSGFDRCELVRGTWFDGWCDFGGSSGAQ